MSSFIRSDILSLPGYVPGEQPREGEAVKLNTNENPYRASEKVYDAIRRVCDKGLSRYPNALGEAFRQKAADVYGVSPEMVLCGNGSDDILTILTRSFVGAGEKLRLAKPSYILYKTLALLQAGQAEEIRFNDDWTLPDSFGQPPADGGRLKLVYLPNPNSPSGTILSKERIWELAESLPCPILVDEAYADFAGSSCIDLVRRTPKIMVSRTLSKGYALAGLRFGYLFAQPETIEQLVKMKDSYNCDALAIAAATAAIGDFQWLAETRSKILATRARLTDAFRSFGFVVPTSSANFTWNVFPDKKFSHKALYEYLKQNGYLVRYMDYGDCGDGLRISVGTDPQIDDLIRLTERFLNEKRGEK